MGSFQSSLSQSVHSIVVVLSCHAIHQWGGNSVRKWECFAQNTAAIKSQATLVEGLDIEFWFGMQRLLKLRIFGFHSGVCQCWRSDHNAVRCSTWLDFSMLGIIPIGIHIFIFKQPGFTTSRPPFENCEETSSQWEVCPPVRRWVRTLMSWINGYTRLVVYYTTKRVYLFIQDIRVGVSVASHLLGLMCQQQTQSYF